MVKHRIELLDSFRFIAIISVLLYHLTSPYVTLYPHKDFFLHVFKYGFLGVNFFFIISGFVISYTLENTPSLLYFYRNRFVRLFPSMLLCTLLTFIIVRSLDDYHHFTNAYQIKNFVPSLTFINPSLWTLVTKIDFHWINGSYWSLWPEIQFYIISSGLYFFSKRNFFGNMLLAGIVISVSKYIPFFFLNHYIQHPKSNSLQVFLAGWKYGNELFNITFYIAWFLCGMVFYQLFKGFKIKNKIFSVACSVVILFCLVWDTWTFFTASFNATMVSSLLMFALFLLMIYKKKYLLFLEHAFLYRLGIISYTIYLIHEDIGIVLINKYYKYLGSWSALSPFIIIIIITCFAELSYRFYEKKAAHLLKQLFSNPGKSDKNAQ